MSTNHQQQLPTIINVPINKSADMNDLPNELLLFIFKHLKIRDLIQCRRVCKRFMLFCDNVKLPELIISNNTENMKDYWFHTKKQFNHRDAIELRTFTAYRYIFRLDKFLKRLRFKGSYSDYDQLKLNEMTQLEQLKIDLEVSDDDAMKVMHINLPNLKVLEIGEEEKCHFYFTTPKLEMLKCCEFDTIHLADPNTVNHLELTFFFNSETARSLKNVQYFKVDWGFLPNEDILSVYPKLTTLVCNKLDSYSDEDDAESMDSLRHFLVQKLKRPEFKIYFQSVEMVDADKIEEYEFARSILAFQIDNYNLLCDNIAFDDPINYNELMKIVKGTLPDDFHKKYFNIPSVSVSGQVESQEHLVRFLKSLDYLKKLYLENTLLDQSFYDGLNEIGRLTELRIRGETSKSVVNYEFLFNLKVLQTFDTDRDSPDFFDLTLALFRRLKHFGMIHFYSDHQFIAVDKAQNQYRFRLFKDSSDRHMREALFEKCQMDFDCLVRLINAYKNFRSNSKNLFDLSFVYDE